MKRFVKVGLLLTAMVVLLSSCNCFNKMSKNIDDVRASSTPELLMLKGSTVTADIRVDFPAKYFDKKALLRITPVLVFDGGEITGTPKYVQGESVKDNYTVISKANGGSYTQTVTFPYDERASISTLELRVEGVCGANSSSSSEFMHLTTIQVAQGVSAVQNSADWTAYLSIMPDNFKRVTTISEDAEIMYVINSANVRPNALNTDQIRMFEEFVRENKDKDRVTLGNVYAQGYASPDGPVSFNDKLSRDRSETGRDAISKKMKDVDLSYDAAAYGEDWEGFRQLVEASNIPDKDLILQVLQLYSSPVQRDQEIHNMAQVFEVLKRDILPQLRRTKLVANADIQGKTDEELRGFVNGNINELNVEEMLFSATLFEDNSTKQKVYKAAADKYNDVRAYNNYGVTLAREGNYAEARRAFERAAAINSAPEISNNMGVLALAEGNVDQARNYLNPLNSNDARANKGLIALAEGDYATAVRDLNGYNLAVAEVCNGNLDKAKSALGNINTADADYLRAVIAMREGQSSAATTHLRSAVSKDSDLRHRAQRDIEFARLFGTPEFNSI